MKIKESQLRKIIQESLKELDWKTYANAAKKAHEWRNEHPFLYDRNRGLDFDNAAQKSFNQQHDIENNPMHGGEKGNINFTSFHGEPELSGSREHDFGDGGGPFNLKHNVYHMSKKYGKDGGYGRTRMWDHPHETTPEEFFDNDEMAKKFRDAEQDVDDYKNGNYEYTTDKGWHLKESRLNKIIKESIKKVLKEDFGDGYDGYVLHAYIPGLGNKCTLIKSLDDAKKYISNAEYWDITKGSNSSELSNLIAWGGEGGYWYNVVNKPAWATGGTWKKLSDSQIQYILSKKQN